MSDADKVIYLESLLSEVIHTLEMTQYDIEDATESHNVVMKADKFYDQMLTILHANWCPESNAKRIKFANKLNKSDPYFLTTNQQTRLTNDHWSVHWNHQTFPND